MATLPTNRTTSNTPTEMVSDHNIIHGLWNIGTTKGDLIGVTGAQAYARIPVGTNGQVLSADSVASPGISWAAAGGFPARNGWHLQRVANLSIPIDTGTAISWDTEVQDTPNNFTPAASGATLMTIPSGGDGLWYITFNLVAQATMSNFQLARMEIVAGGLTFRGIDFDDQSTPIAPEWTLSIVVPLVATNTIQCIFVHSALAATNFQGRFIGYKIGS